MCVCAQVIASFINPGGLIPKDFEAASEGGSSDECSEREDSDHSSLPALLPDLLTQSCLVPALSSYLRNDSGTGSFFLLIVSTFFTLVFIIISTNAGRIFPQLHKQSINAGS